VTHRTDLRAMIAHEVAGGLGPRDAAQAAVAQLSAEQLRDSVMPIAEGLARDVIRRQARRVEDDAFAVVEETGEFSVVLGREELVAQHFALPDGRWVRWDTATADDHIARAQWQETYASACTIDAQRHRQAAAFISQNGVTCLAEIVEVPSV
jgi:L-lactate utilization protein LutC